MRSSSMIDAIAAHKAAWQAFQDAPAGDDDPDTLRASACEREAMWAMLRTLPESPADVAALKSYLDWWVVEEEQRRECEPELFALHAIIRFAAQVASGVIAAAQAIVDSVGFDDHGSVIAGEYRGGNGGLLSNDTIKAADVLRAELLMWKQVVGKSHNPVTAAADDQPLDNKGRNSANTGKSGNSVTAPPAPPAPPAGGDGG